MRLGTPSSARWNRRLWAAGGQSASCPKSEGTAFTVPGVCKSAARFRPTSLVLWVGVGTAGQSEGPFHHRLEYTRQG